MTYGFLLLFAFVRTISYQNWFVNVDLYYLQLFTIIAYHLNAHIMLLPYVICNYIWHMGSQNFELLSSIQTKCSHARKWLSIFSLNKNVPIARAKLGTRNFMFLFCVESIMTESSCRAMLSINVLGRIDTKII